MRRVSCLKRVNCWESFFFEKQRYLSLFLSLSLSSFLSLTASSSTTMTVTEASAVAAATAATAGGFCGLPLSPSTMSCEGSFVAIITAASASTARGGGTCPSPPWALGAVGALFQSCLSVGAAISLAREVKRGGASENEKGKM